MKKKNNENLNELLVKFFDGKTASKMADNIAAGDRIFSSYPARLPTGELLADIKQKMISAAQKKHQQSIRFIWQYAAAAAIIIIVFGVSLTLLNKPALQMQDYASGSIWQDTFNSIENRIEIQLAEIDISEPDSSLVTLEISGSSETSAIADITTELDDIDASFWEG